MGTSFGEIIEGVVNKTPGAIGGAFAAADGEMVDSYAKADAEEWALITAHYGIVLSHIQAALNTFHYGEADFVVMTHAQIDILVRSVDEGYYALVAARHPAPLGLVMGTLEAAAAELRKEMM